MKIISNKSIQLIVMLIAAIWFSPVQAQGVCVEGCNDNAFLNTHDPYTLEYDNLISGFHTTIAKRQDGKYLIWGQGARPYPGPGGVVHFYEPTLITPENGFDYTGDILKATLGTGNSTTGARDQFAILTTTGLYIWGGQVNWSKMVHSSVKSTRDFEKITSTHIKNANEFGLPAGVKPEDVKMLFGSYGTLAIVTCDGAAYVLSHTGNKYGNGLSGAGTGNENYKNWHRVLKDEDGHEPLENVIAMRGVPGAMVALTSDGMYTWGTYTFLGDNSSNANRLYATKMTLPPGVEPEMIKMIGMTSADGTNNYRYNTYYLLTTGGHLYALGDNRNLQLGRFISDYYSETWGRVKSAPDTEMTDVVWVSPNEHDGDGNGTVTALTADGKLWGWGLNAEFMLGQSSSASSYHPKYMFGDLDPNDKIIAVETGGHIITIFKECENGMGYIGHNINGSYATYSPSPGTSSRKFQFNGAQFSGLCAVPLPPLPELIDLKACPGSTFNLMDALQNPVPEGYNLEWWASSSGNYGTGTQIVDFEAVGPGNYYAFFVPDDDEDECYSIVGVKVNTSYYTLSDPKYHNECVLCYRDPKTNGPSSETQVGISLIKGRETLQSSDNWPQSRKSGFIALESNKQGMVVTRIANENLGSIISPQEGMMVYDTDDKCLKIYSDGEWKCFSTPACP